MSIETAERELFGEALACDEVLPAMFAAGDGDDEAARERAAERSESLLRSIAQVEDMQGEDGEDRGAAELALQRVEAKLNLLLELVGEIVRRDSAPLPEQPVRWSRHGLAVPAEAAVVPGMRGLLRLQPAAWLPQVLELPAEVVAVGDREGRRWAWLRFSPLPGALESAIERHLFRLHRRAIAGARRQR